MRADERRDRIYFEVGTSDPETWLSSWSQPELWLVRKNMGEDGENRRMEAEDGWLPELWSHFCDSCPRSSIRLSVPSCTHPSIPPLIFWPVHPSIDPRPDHFITLIILSVFFLHFFFCHALLSTFFLISFFIASVHICIFFFFISPFSLQALNHSVHLVLSLVSSYFHPSSILSVRVFNLSSVFFSCCSRLCCWLFRPLSFFLHLIPPPSLALPIPRIEAELNDSNLPHKPLKRQH